MFEYGAILKGSQTIGSGRCIIARKSEFSAFLRFRVEIFLVLVYIISGICTTIRIGRLLGSFTIQGFLFIWIFLFESVCSAKCALISSLTCNALPCPTSE